MPSRVLGRLLNCHDGWPGGWGGDHSGTESVRVVRDRSLITGRVGGTKWENSGSNIVALPLQDRVKLLVPPPLPFFPLNVMH